MTLFPCRPLWTPWGDSPLAWLTANKTRRGSNGKVKRTSAGKLKRASSTTGTGCCCGCPGSPCATCATGTTPIAFTATVTDVDDTGCQEVCYDLALIGGTGGIIRLRSVETNQTVCVQQPLFGTPACLYRKNITGTRPPGYVDSYPGPGCTGLKSTVDDVTAYRLRKVPGKFIFDIADGTLGTSPALRMFYDEIAVTDPVNCTSPPVPLVFTNQIGACGDVLTDGETGNQFIGIAHSGTAVVTACC